MNTEEKARRYDEALEKMRKMFKSWSELAYNGKTFLQDLKHIFPELAESELAESEDEMSRKWILEFLCDGLRKADPQFKEQFKTAIAYIEKQKESLHISKTCKENADSFTDENKRVREELVAFFKEMQNSAWHEKYWHDIEIAHILAYLEKQKESPKSTDSIPTDCTLDAKCEDRWHKVEDSLPDNGREVLAKDTLGNLLLARYDGEGWDVSVCCHNDVSKWCEIPSEKQKEQKPEWSDDEFLKTINLVYKAIRKALASLAVYAEDEALLDSKEATLCYYSQRCTEKIFKSLLLQGSKDSLQTHWKPSEEQMSMLLAVINDPNNAGAESCYMALKSIYNNLKKLM